MTPVRFAAVLLLAAGWLAAPARADDAADVKAAIQENYAAYSSFDEARYRRTTTEDFLLLEHGELIDREGDVANMAKPGTGFRRTDHFDFDSVKVHDGAARASASGWRARSSGARTASGRWRSCIRHAYRTRREPST